MRLTIAHETVYRFETPAAGIIQTLHLTPRSFNGQHVSRWRIDVDQDCRLEPHEDAFGNLAHTFTVSGPLASLTVRVDGIVETADASGIMSGLVERFPPALFLRDTPLTHAGSAIGDLARTARTAAAGDTLATLHDLMRRVHDAIASGTAPERRPANEVLASGIGDARDRAHLFIAAGRYLGIPARFVSGYAIEPGVEADDTHAWAEAHVAGLGWVGFDPHLDLCPRGGHIRLASALDELGAAPVRGTHYRGAGESRAIRVAIGQAQRQVQA